MLRRMLSAAALIVLLSLPFAAGWLRMGAVRAVSEADYQDEVFQTTAQNAFGFQYSDSLRFQSSLTNYLSLFKGHDELKYNVVVINANGHVEYNYNKKYVKGSTVALVASGSNATLLDVDTGSVLKLQMNDVLPDNLMNVLGEKENIEKARKSARQATGSIYAQLEGYDSINHEDGTWQITNCTIFLYDEATQVYMASSHTGDIRAGASQSNTVALALLAAFWLLLPLWVLLDARGRVRRPWLAALAVLLTNVVGLAAYLIARSQGFPRLFGPTCRQCGEPMEHGWARCPRCGAEEARP